MSPADRQQRAAVIDIGSNSVRLVIYSVWRACALPTFNEKVMAGLGRGLASSGQLSPEGKLAALAALRRFRAILQGLGVQNVRAVATAAVRVASDGAQFAHDAAIAAGVPLTILSGQDEGRLSAEGVASGMYVPDGLVGDLGGSSLELYPIGQKQIVAGETHMLGPLALGDLEQASPAKIRQAITTVLHGSALVSCGAERLYAVGGAWRAFAKVDMARRNYPLRLLNHYTLTAESVDATLRDILNARKDKLAMQKLAKIAGRRSAQLHLSGSVLATLAAMANIREVVISAAGLREGVVRELTGAHVHDDGALADGTIVFAQLNGAQVAFGEALLDFVMPTLVHLPTVFADAADDRRLFGAACLMADSAGRFHPDHRAEMAYDQTLRSPCSDASHAQRAFIALAVGARYDRGFRAPQRFQSLLSPAASQRARQLGLVMRLGAVISGRSAPLLRRVSLTQSHGRLELMIGREDHDLVSETVERRLTQAAEGLELTAHIVERPDLIGSARRSTV